MSALVHGAIAASAVVVAAWAGGEALSRWRAHRVVGRLGGHLAGQVAGHPEADPQRGADGAGGAPPPAVAGWRVRTVVSPPVWLVGRIEAAFPGVDPAAAASAWVMVAPAVVFGGGVLGGVGLALCGVVVVLAGPALALAWRRGAAARALEAALPDALEAVARALRSGAGTHQALAEAAAASSGPLRAELAVVVRDLAGATLAGALGDLERRRPVAGIRLAVAALLLGAEAGGAHARALDGVAATVRARLGVSDEVRALSSQTRLSAGVIAGAPVAFAALAIGTDSSNATFLLRTPLGLACLVLGLALDVAGAWWMHHLAQVDA